MSKNQRTQVQRDQCAHCWDDDRDGITPCDPAAISSAAIVFIALVAGVILTIATVIYRTCFGA